MRGQWITKRKNGLAELKRRILAKDNVSKTNEIIDIKTYLILLRENKKGNDLTPETIVMRKLLAKILWHHKLRNKSSITKTNNDSKHIIHQFH